MNSEIVSVERNALWVRHVSSSNGLVRARVDDGARPSENRHLVPALAKASRKYPLKKPVPSVRNTVSVVSSSVIVIHSAYAFEPVGWVD